MSEKTMPTGPGTFCWMELMTTDTSKAKDFYTKLLGWNTEEMDMGECGTYTIFKIRDQGLGGMMKISTEMGPIPPHWLAYVAVDDVDASTTQARELGAEVLSPPMDIPAVGRFSVVKDPTGAAIALFQGNG